MSALLWEKIGNFDEKNKIMLVYQKFGLINTKEALIEFSFDLCNFPW